MRLACYAIGLVESRVTITDRASPSQGLGVDVSVAADGFHLSVCSSHTEMVLMPKTTVRGQAAYLDSVYAAYEKGPRMKDEGHTNAES